LRAESRKAGHPGTRAWLHGRHRTLLGGGAHADDEDEEDGGGGEGWGQSWGEGLGAPGRAAADDEDDEDDDEDRRYLVALARGELGHLGHLGGFSGSRDPALAAAVAEAGLVCVRRLVVAHAGSHAAARLDLELRCAARRPRGKLRGSGLGAVHLLALATSRRGSSSSSSSGRRLVGRATLRFEPSPAAATAGGGGSAGSDEGQAAPDGDAAFGALGRWQPLACGPLASLDAGDVVSLWALPWPSERAWHAASGDAARAGSSGASSGNDSSSSDSSSSSNSSSNSSSGGPVDAAALVAADALALGPGALLVEARRVRLSRGEAVASWPPPTNSPRFSAAAASDLEGLVLAAARAAASMPALLTLASATPMHYARTGADWL
jgi:hypothetical protein